MCRKHDVTGIATSIQLMFVWEGTLTSFHKVIDVVLSCKEIISTSSIVLKKFDGGISKGHSKMNLGNLGTGVLKSMHYDGIKIKQKIISHVRKNSFVLRKSHFLTQYLWLSKAFYY